MMPNNRALAATCAVLLLGWFIIRLGIYGLAMYPNTVMGQYFRWQDFTTYLLVLIFTPAVMWKARWTALGALVVGAIRILAGAIGLYVFMTYPPAVSLILALLMTYFSFRAYQEK
jgi:hypothetical protein